MPFSYKDTRIIDEKRCVIKIPIKRKSTILLKGMEHLQKLYI